MKEVSLPPEGKCIKCGASFTGWALETYGNRSCQCGGNIIIEPSKYSWIIERHPQPKIRSRPMVQRTCSGHLNLQRLTVKATIVSRLTGHY